MSATQISEYVDTLKRFIGWKAFVEYGEPEHGDVPPPAPWPEPHEASGAFYGLLAQLESLLTTTERLFQMIPREVWRDQGGDDGQGHYEGEHYAEQIEQELVALRSALGSS